MKHTFEESYLGQLLVVVRPLISPGARAIIRDENGWVLLIQRGDNGNWGMLAGFKEFADQP